MFTSATDLPANALTDTALHSRIWPKMHFFPTALERPRFPQSVPANCRKLRKDPSIYVFSVRMALCFNIYQRGALPLPLITINCAHESARMFSGVTSFMRMDHFLSQCWTVRRTWKRNESAASSLVTSHSTLRWCRASNRTAI